MAGEELKDMMIPALKFSKRGLLLIPIGVFLLVALVLNTVRWRQMDQGDALSQKLALTQAKMQAIQPEPLSSQKTDLQRQLDEAKTRLDTARSVLSQPVKKTATTDALFATAKASSVEITKMNLSGLADATIEKLPISAMTVSLSIEGDVANLTSFITQLNTIFPTGAIETATITNSEEGSGKNPSAEIEMKLYTVQNR